MSTLGAHLQIELRQNAASGQHLWSMLMRRLRSASLDHGRLLQPCPRRAPPPAHPSTSLAYRCHPCMAWSGVVHKADVTSVKVLPVGCSSSCALCQVSCPPRSVLPVHAFTE